MDEDKYFESINPMPWTILGVRMLPLSLGHLIILRSIKSPFVMEDKTITIGDLVLAVMVCSRTYDEGLEALDSEDLMKQVNRWGLELRGRFRWFGWFRKPIEIDWKEKLDLFREYFNSYSKEPDYSYDSKSSRAINCPIYQMIRITLLSELNLTEKEILNRPYNQCLIDYLTIKAIAGQANFIDAEANLAAQEKANALHERLNNGKLKFNS